MLDTDLAYLAGMIDGDGHITIRRMEKANKGRAKPGVYHELVVGISGTRREPHDLAVSLFGGSVACYGRSPHQAVYNWRASGPTAVLVLTAIRPFLRIKRANAELGIEFQALLERHRADQRQGRPPYRITDEQRAERDELWSRMTVLNKPGNRRRWKTDAAGRLLDGRTHDEVP